MTSATRSRLKLGLIALLFLLPFVIAVGLRFGGWEPPRTRNFGELLEPPLPMHGIGATRSDDGRPWSWENTEHEWTLLARVPATCAADCRERLDMLPRVRESLGRHAGRLHLFRIAGNGTDAVPLPALRLDGALPGPLAAPLDGEQPEVALIDPHGFLVLHYPAGFDPSELRKDLGRLLR